MRRNLNPNLSIHGVVLTMFDPRNNLAGQVVADVRGFMGDKVYETVIPRNVRVSEAPSHGKPVLLYDIRCSGSQAYIRLASRGDPARTAAARRMRDAMAEEARPRLGRGLAALIGDAGTETAAIDRLRGQRLVPIEFLRPNPRNPRKDFDEAELEDLSASIKERGILQPILVRTIAGVADAYEIIAGERRWRAAQRASVHDVPIILIEADEKAALEIAVIENVQRADLNPLEEAMGYEQLGNEFGYSQGDLARIIGKSRSSYRQHAAAFKTADIVAPHARRRAFVGGACARSFVRCRSRCNRKAYRRAGDDGSRCRAHCPEGSGTRAGEREKSSRAA